MATDERIDLADLLSRYRPVSANGRVWTWEDEERDILARECLCCGEVGHYQQQLEAHLAEAEIVEGICVNDLHQHRFTMEFGRRLPDGREETWLECRCGARSAETIRRSPYFVDKGDRSAEALERRARRLLATAIVIAVLAIALHAHAAWAVVTTTEPPELYGTHHVPGLDITRRDAPPGPLEHRQLPPATISRQRQSGPREGSLGSVGSASPSRRPEWHPGALAGPAEVRAIICGPFASVCGKAMAVVACETGGTWDPRAVGDAGERGLWQIHPVHARPGGLLDRLGLSWDAMFDPAANTAAAWALYSEQGWGPWACG